MQSKRESTPPRGQVTGAALSPGQNTGRLLVEARTLAWQEHQCPQECPGASPPSSVPAGLSHPALRVAGESSRGLCRSYSASVKQFPAGCRAAWLSVLSSQSGCVGRGAGQVRPERGEELLHGVGEAGVHSGSFTDGEGFAESVLTTVLWDWGGNETSALAILQPPQCEDRRVP